MIRCSQLQLAERCGLASRLAEQYPETSQAAERGTAIHVEIASGKPVSAEARAALEWLPNGQKSIEHEVPVRLLDPETGDVITAGTADVLAIDDRGVLQVIDWKTGSPDYVTAPDDNLQLLAYGVAAALNREAPAFRVALAFLDGDQVDVRWSIAYWGDTWWPLIDRIKAAASAPPVARTGPHCSSCWQRKHCSAWLLPAFEGETALKPFTEGGGGLTSANVARALELRDVMRTMLDTMDGQIEAYVREAGPVRVGDREFGCWPTRGRRTGPTLAELEAQGLGHLIKQGAPTTRMGWRKAS